MNRRNFIAATSAAAAALAVLPAAAKTVVPKAWCTVRRVPNATFLDAIPAAGKGRSWVDMTCWSPHASQSDIEKRKEDYREYGYRLFGREFILWEDRDVMVAAADRASLTGMYGRAVQLDKAFSFILEDNLDDPLWREKWSRQPGDSTVLVTRFWTGIEKGMLHEREAKMGRIIT